MPDVVRPCVHSKGGDVMPRPTLFYRVCIPRAVMSCHARCSRLCVLSKGGDVMPRSTSSDRACSPRALISCHAPRRPTVCAVQGWRWHGTPDVIRPCVLSKGGDGMPRPTSSDRVLSYCGDVIPRLRCRLSMLSKGDDGMPRPTTADRLCSPK